MTDANNLRRFMNLMERSAADYVGPKTSDTVEYSAEETKGEISKVVANLKSYDSGRYTKLGRNLLKVEALEKEIKVLKEETKQEARELVADLFHAEDAVATRVVETVSFTFHMSKDPKAAETYKYAKILEELQEQLTPELIEVLEALKEKHKTTNAAKPASLKATDKAAPVAAESIVEGWVGDALEKGKAIFAKLLNWIENWGAKYDARLDALKREAAI